MDAAGRQEVVIVGGGLSGIGMAATLAGAGIEDYVLLERGDGLGGTAPCGVVPAPAAPAPTSSEHVDQQDTMAVRSVIEQPSCPVDQREQRSSPA